MGHITQAQDRAQDQPTTAALPISDSNLRELADKGVDTSRRNKNIGIDTLIVLANKGYSYAEIANIVGCSPQNVRNRLLAYDYEGLKVFRENKDSVFERIQRELAASLNAEDIKNMAPRDRIMGIGILEDKIRLIRGQATDITVNVDAVKAIQERRAELERRIRELTGGIRPQDIVVDAEIGENVRDNVTCADSAETKLIENTAERAGTSDNMHYVNLRENVSNDDAGASPGSSRSDARVAPRPAPRRGRPRKAR